MAPTRTAQEFLAAAVAGGLVMAGFMLSSGTVAAIGPKPSVTQPEIRTVTATVVAIDLPNRIVTLKGPSVNTLPVLVDDQVKNLSAVSVGDRVLVRYYESLVIEARKAHPGEQTSIKGMSASWVSDGQDQKPSTGRVTRVQVSARVMALDKPSGVITLKGPRGNIRTFHLTDPTKITNVTVGDLIVVTYTAERAVSVEPQ